jgi:hypothetical protein
MTSSNNYMVIGVMVVILGVILVGSIIFFIYKPFESPLQQNTSLDTCPPGQKCPTGNSTLLSKDNLTQTQKKISTDLLQLTDSRYLPVGMTRDALELQMEQNHQLTHVAQTGETLVYVYIQTSASADTTPINSSVWNVTNSDPANHLVVAWVDVSNLINLASLESVQSIQTVTPPITWRG